MNRDVRLRVETALPERLIARALEAGAVFAEIRMESRRCMVLDLDPASADILKRLCKKFGCDCRELHRHGAAALLSQLRRRWTLLLALALGVILCALALSRIWIVEIEFTGEHPITPSARQQMLACLDENGIRPGVSKSRVTVDLLEKELCAQAPRFGHIGVKLQGIRLLTELAPLDQEPQLYKIDAPGDLVARQSGVIEQVHVYSGRAAVQKDDTVLRGDLLIRGEESIAKDDETGEMITRPVGALGEVIARCWYEGHASAPLKEVVRQRTGRASRSDTLRLMHLRLPVSRSDAYSTYEEEMQILPIGGLYLPLELVRTTHFETREIEIPADRSALEAQLTALARADALRQIEGAVNAYEIAAFWTDAQVIDNTLHIRAVYGIYTDIASDRDALIEEVY